LSDRYGRKVIIVGGLMVFVTGSLVAALSDSIYGIIAGRFLQGMGAIASTLMALVSDLTQLENRSKAMMMVGMSIGLSFSLALIIGPWLGTAFGLHAIFWVCALLGLLGMGVLLIFVPDTRQKALPDARLLSEKLWTLLADGRLGRFNVSIFLLHYLLMSSFMAFPLFLRSTGQIADGDHHWVYLGVLMASLLPIGFLMWLVDKRHLTRWMLAAMTVCFIVAFLMLEQGAGLNQVIGAFFVFFMAFNLLEVTLPSQVSRQSPAGTRGTAMGIYSSWQFAGAFVGGTIGGLLLQTWDMTVLMTVNAVICVLWMLLFITMAVPRDLVGKTVFFRPEDQRSAIDRIDALLSVAGVEDVVLLSASGNREDEHRVAYLKVDNTRFNEHSLAALEIEKIV
ncbi:MAG: MFS transporter, partial [Gammaproteobacteria bacterium]|nr:MFS transporter [Gammaproteobacteria bacterium]